MIVKHLSEQSTISTSSSSQLQSLIVSSDHLLSSIQRSTSSTYCPTLEYTSIAKTNGPGQERGQCSSATQLGISRCTTGYHLLPVIPRLALRSSRASSFLSLPRIPPRVDAALRPALSELILSLITYLEADNETIFIQLGSPPWGCASSRHCSSSHHEVLGQFRTAHLGLRSVQV